MRKGKRHNRVLCAAAFMMAGIVALEQVTPAAEPTACHAETELPGAEPMACHTETELPAAEPIIHHTETDLGDTDDRGCGSYLEMPWELDVPAADPELSPSLADELLKGNGADCPGELAAEGDAAEAVESAYPAAYTESEALTEYFSKVLPPTRDQRPYEACWAYSSVALAEIYDIFHGGADAGSIDYSERHLAHYTYSQGNPQMYSQKVCADSVTVSGNTPDEQDLVILGRGGNIFDAAANLHRWRGLADERRAPYPVNDTGDSLPLEPAVQWSTDAEYDALSRLKDCYILNLRANPRLVKQYIRENGCVATSCFHTDQDETYYSESNHAYYCPDEKKTNHAITIVGWDDDYPRENFAITPSSDGAWLVRNSWAEGSTEMSVYSYFWLSYEDRSIADAAYVYIMQSSEEWADHNYYYDSQIHAISRYANREGGLRAANVFTAAGSARQEAVVSVSFQVSGFSAFFADGVFDYLIRVYTDLSDPACPDSGRLAATKEGVLSYPGIYTIPLDEPVLVDHDSQYAVVVMLDNGTQTVDQERDYCSERGEIVARAGRGAGQSYYSCAQNSPRWAEPASLTIVNPGSANSRVENLGNYCIGAQSVDMPDQSEEAENRETENRETENREAENGDESPGGQRSGQQRSPLADGESEIIPQGPGKEALSKENQKEQIRNILKKKGYKQNGDGASVTLVAPPDPNVTAFCVPAAVTAKGKTFKVTGIGAKAFAGCRKLKKVTIGANVTVIGAKAFYGCGRLKKITIRTLKLTRDRAGKKAFARIDKKAVFTLPRLTKKRKKEYGKLLKKMGIPKTAGIR